MLLKISIIDVGNNYDNINEKSKVSKLENKTKNQKTNLAAMETKKNQGKEESEYER